MKYLLIALVLITASCSHGPQRSPFQSERSFASTQVFSRFIEKIALQSNKSVDTLETTILQYIRTQQKNSTHGNWSALGITEDQAKQIKSLSDDHPFMDRVRKWVSENINTAASVDKSIAQKVFQDVINDGDSRGLINPYTVGSTARGTRQQQASPFKSIDNKQQVILKDIESLPDSKIQKLHRKNLSEFQKRGKDSPSIHANGQEIVQSATIINKKTGLKAMGEGCEEFTKNASSEVLAIKADVDLYRAQLVEDAAHAKAGRSFASVDDIPKEKRLTTEELDEIDAIAFRDKLGYTDDEARAALSRLKSKPCKLY